MADKVYASCDRAIKVLNRESLREFNKLKLADFKSTNVIRTVRKMYRKLAKKAEEEYLDVGYDAYLYAMMMCDIDRKEALKMVDDAITGEWIRQILEETDFVTLYRFDSETASGQSRLGSMPSM